MPGGKCSTAIDKEGHGVRQHLDCFSHPRTSAAHEEVSHRHHPPLHRQKNILDHPPLPIRPLQQKLRPVPPLSQLEAVPFPRLGALSQRRSLRRVRRRVEHFEDLDIAEILHLFSHQPGSLLPQGQRQGDPASAVQPEYPHFWEERV